MEICWKLKFSKIATFYLTILTFFSQLHDINSTETISSLFFSSELDFITHEWEFLTILRKKVKIVHLCRNSEKKVRFVHLCRNSEKKVRFWTKKIINCTFMRCKSEKKSYNCEIKKSRNYLFYNFLFRQKRTSIRIRVIGFEHHEESKRRHNDHSEPWNRRVWCLTIMTIRGRTE